MTRFVRSSSRKRPVKQGAERDERFNVKPLMQEVGRMTQGMGAWSMETMDLLAESTCLKMPNAGDGTVEDASDGRGWMGQREAGS
ncbi:hypothetical protein Z517_12327 [Fonsecaea pedrosoi CBS 271.37]|uniref:Uncharacterized protein n=1 Tax=Fonsecaea pedrosoi CBS 271.37 TaxID=1442368 RepID=A0A0D2EJ32_9EURO|nr:uncharacterized protein Z517_12327 [Fonsecaea pedrosoi CBS 271.37]KIW74387.1 hypothetical protein Z517_12327 [Fonsecaea pedrosoi CBS 271.37]